MSNISDILQEFKTFRTKLASRKFRIYVDYKSTDFMLDNHVRYSAIRNTQKYPSHSPKLDTRNGVLIEGEQEVDEFLMGDALSNICVYNNMGQIAFLPVNGPKMTRLLDTHVKESDNPWYAVEYIEELQCINLVSNVLGLMYKDAIEDSEDFYLCSLMYMLSCERSIYTNMNRSAVTGNSKSTLATLRKALPGCFAIPTGLGLGTTVCPLPTIGSLKYTDKIKPYMTLPNGKPDSVNIDKDGSLCDVYHTGQISELLGVRDGQDPINKFLLNNTDFCIQILHAIMSTTYGRREFQVLSYKGNPLALIHPDTVCDSITEPFTVSRNSYLSFIKNLYKFNYMSDVEFEQKVSQAYGA